MYGPYESEPDTRVAPMAREVRALRESAEWVRAADPGALSSGVRMRHVLAACEQAGVSLGAYDRRVLEWLCGWEDGAVQVLIGLLARAGAAAAEGDEPAC